MAKPIKMPKLSDEMTEGKIAGWLKKVGDEVKAGDVIAQVETDKATLDVEAFDTGVLVGVAVNAGESAPVGQAIGWIGARGEKAPGAAAEAPRTPQAEAPPAVPAAAPPSRGSRQAPSQAIHRETSQAGRVAASPAARRRAREDGIDIGTVEGSGPRGRIVLADVQRAPAAGAPTATPPVDEARPPEQIAPRLPASPPREPFRAPQPAAAPAPPHGRRRELPPRVELKDETIALSPMRRAIARNLAVSKPGAPHYYLEISADMRRMLALREQLEELGGEQPVSLNDLVVKAAADALSRHPEVNAAWGADAIVRRGSVDVGVAVALDDGLVTPVVRGADRKGVFEIAREIRELAGRARERRLRPEEYQGASFTISNLGMFGIEAFYAVINPPEAAILAVGTVQRVPWVDAAGEIVAMERMRLGLSGDHRVIDGATGARFLGTLRTILESPVRLVLG